MKFERLAFIQSFYTLLSKFSGYVRDIFLAYFIGANILADIFFMALRIPVAFKILLSEETFNAAYIPIFGKVADGNNFQKKYHLAHQLMMATLIIIIPLVVVAEIYMPNILSLLSKNIQDQETMNLFVKSSRIIFPYVIFIGISSILVGTLNTYGRFALTASLPLLINISIILSCFLFPVIPGDLITTLSCSVIFGCVIQFIALLYALKDQFFFQHLYENILNLKRDFLIIKSFMVLLWPTLLASTIIFLNLIFGIIIASKDVGGVSLLYYSERIFYLPLTLIGISIGIVLLPVMSVKNILKDHKAIQKLHEKAYRLSIISILPISLVLIFLSKDIITLFFYRGVFELGAVTKSTLALNLYLLGLPAAVIVKILIPYLYAISQPKLALKTIALSTLSCLILTIIFFQIIGFLSVPLGLSIASWINMFLLFKIHYKLNTFSLNSSLIIYTLKSAFFALFLFCFLIAIDEKLSYFILNDLFKIIIELFLILIPSMYFVYKMEVDLYRKFIIVLRNFFKIV